MTKLKSPLSFFSKVLILTIIAIFVLSFLPSVKALGSPQTGYLTSNDKNVGLSLTVSGYTIYATDKIVFFYNSSSATYLKQFSVFNTTMQNYNSEIKTNIWRYNSTHILIGCVYTEQATYWYCHAKTYLLRLSSLSYVKVFDSDRFSIFQYYGTPSPYIDLAFVENNNVTYLYAQYTINDYYYTDYPVSRLYEVKPTYSYIGQKLNDIKAKGCSIFIPSNTLTDAYLLTNTNESCSIWKIDLTTFTTTYIGNTGDYLTYSGIYVYLADFIYHSVGGDYYYDVLIYYPDYVTVKVTAMELIRFNDSSVSYTFKFIDCSSDNGSDVDSGHVSSSTILRVLSVQLPNALYGNGTLTSGIYKFLYPTTYNVGLKNHPIAMFYTELQDLDTITPVLVKDTILTEYYPTYETPTLFYFTSSSNVGGYANPFGNVIIELDYTNSQIISDTFASLNALFGYEFVITPEPLSMLVGGNTATYKLYANQQYIYTGSVTYNGIQAGDGSFTVNSTGLGSTESIQSLGTYQQVTSGVITRGSFQFAFAPKTITNVRYEGLKIKVVVGSVIYTHNELANWIIKEAENNPNNPSGGNEGYGGFDFTWFIVVFLAIFVAPMVFGAMLGIAGFMGGLILATGIAVSTGLLPFWIVIIVGLFLFITFMLWRR